MRIAIIADIHEDFQMLQKAINSLKSEGYDLLVCLGDITGFAHDYYTHTPDANACIDVLREFADIVLTGNHDLYSARRLPSYHLEKNIPLNWYDLTPNERNARSNNILWLYEEEIMPILSPENKAFLANLSETKFVENGQSQILFSHFLQPDLAGISRWFPSRVTEFRQHFKFMEENNANLSFVGHYHPVGTTIVSKLFWSPPCFNTTRISQKPRIVLCPPVVRTTNSSTCLIFDTVSSVLTPIFLNPNSKPLPIYLTT